jgi:hypothetical protein
VEHLLTDHRDGPEVSRSKHYEECAQLIEGHSGENVTKRVRETETESLRPHFHVWEPITFTGFSPPSTYRSPSSCFRRA